VVVTGGTGTGKTSFLEAIIAGKERVAAYGPMLPDQDYLRQGSHAAKVKLLWELDAGERERFGSEAMTIESESMFGAVVTPPQHDPSLLGMLLEYDPQPSASKIEYFHATRRFIPGAAVDATQMGGGMMERAVRLGRDDSKYAGLVKFVVAAGLGFDVDPTGQPRPQGRVTAAFSKLCKTKTLAGLYRSGDGVFPGFQDGAGRAIGVSQLSDGEADAFLFACAFVRQGIRRSVVLVDTPELHKSDAEAKAFVEGLLAVEDDNQFIVATRSPAVVGMVPQNRLVTLG
jgi:predicted ATPase